jgi:hypothetical protein
MWQNIGCDCEIESFKVGSMRAMSYLLILWLSLAGLGRFANTVITAQASGQRLIAVSGPVSPAPVDPNKAPSEFNHHMAGWALIGVGFFALLGFLSRARALRYVWPALFLLAGLFLALWSDAEMWPRGNLSWAWLLHHDQEAGQHKIYALLLTAMGIVEYFRACGSLNRFWRAWAFPILAIVGAAFLLVHDHTASGGATSLEARAYLVNPALDPDGNPPVRHASDPMPGMDRSMMDVDPSGMPMDHSGMDHPSMPMGNDPPSSDTPSPGHHHMTPSMLLVEREHFWFMIVGLGVALLKLMSDAKFWRGRLIPYCWPSGMVLLGVLLLLYRE